MIENQRQYVATVTDAGGGERPFGSRYVFGHIHRHEPRCSCARRSSLSPDLVITVFAQPFVSVGPLRPDRRAREPATGDVRWYDTAVHDGASRTIVDGTNAFSIDEPDYTVASLRSTAVLRWEFRPGSTLYIAWQQDRGGVPLTDRAAAALERRRGVHAVRDPHARGEAQLLVRLVAHGFRLRARHHEVRLLVHVDVAEPERERAALLASPTDRSCPASIGLSRTLSRNAPS